MKTRLLTVALAALVLSGCALFHPHRCHRWAIIDGRAMGQYWVDCRTGEPLKES